MDRQHPPIELSCSLDAANHAFGFDKGEDPDIAPLCPGNRCHTVQGITALENLQIAGNELQGPHPLRPVVQHIRNRGETFILGAAQARRIFKDTTLITILDGQCDGEIISVEMSGEPFALLNNIDDHVGKRVCVPIEVPGAKCRLNEILKRGVFIDRAKSTIRAEMIRWHKGI